MGPASCPIVADTIASLAPPPTLSHFGTADLSRAASASDGRVWISPMSRPNLILTYDKHSGAFRGQISHESGRETEGGSGRIDFISAGQDGEALHVFAEGTHSRYAADRLVSRERIDTYGIIDSAVILADDRFVVNADMRGEVLRGFPLHLMGSTVDSVRSFGGPAPGFMANPIATARALARSTEGAFWSSPQREMRFTLWAGSGEPIMQVVREAPWFEPWTDWVSPTAGIPPPRVWALSEDQRGRLWVMVYLPDEDFRPMTPTGPSIAGDGSRYYDTIIEVLEASAERIVAHCRFDAFLGRFLSGQHVLLGDTDGQGRSVLRLVHLHVP